MKRRTRVGGGLGLRNRRGWGGLEVLVALVLALTVTALGAAWLAHQQRGVLALLARSEVATTLARSTSILTREIRAGNEAIDWTRPAGDTLWIRAFRGRALVCSVSGRSVRVGYRGDRSLDPAKDSVLILDHEARWRPAQVTRDRAGAGLCHGSATRIWTLDRTVSSPTILRVFERGTYGLYGGALRYRRGAGGRQPLTFPRLDTTSALLSGPRGGVEADLRGDGGLAGPSGSRRRVILPRGWR